MNIFQAFQATCRQYPTKACVKFKKGDAPHALTYQELYARVLGLAAELASLGLRPGQRAGILLTSGPEWPTAFFAAAALQAVAVPVDAQLSAEEIGRVLAHAEARVLLTEGLFEGALGETLRPAPACRVVFVDRPAAARADEVEGRAARRFDAGKLAALFYTSGTTQEHKAVLLTHKNLLENFASIQKVGLLKTGDVLMSLLPLHHAYPFMVTCLAPLLQGATVC
jgi:long-chain acyl-CoA synthetase